jgi:hypothetical protein
MMEKMEDFSTLCKEDLIKVIEEKVAEIEKLHGKIRSIIRQNNNPTKRIPKKIGCADLSHYDQSWSFVTKLVFILKKANKPLRSSGILPLLLKYDEKAKYWRNPVSSLGTHLSKSLKYKRILAYKIFGINGSYHVLPQWLDQEGELLPDYLIVPEYK